MTIHPKRVLSLTARLLGQFLGIGVIFAIPVILVYEVVSFILGAVDSAIGSYTSALVHAILPSSWANPIAGDIPGISFALLVVILILLGAFLSTPLGKFVRANFDRLVGKIWGVGALYHLGQKIVSMFTSFNGVDGIRVVAFFPYGEAAHITDYAFVTNEWVEPCTGEEMVQLLVPGKPIPSSGNTFPILKSATWEANITRNQLMGYCFTMGIARPKNVRSRPPRATGNGVTVNLNSDPGSDPDPNPNPDRNGDLGEPSTPTD